MRNHFLFIILFAAVFIISPFKDNGYSESLNTGLKSSAADGEEIELYMGEIKTIPVNNPTRIAIGKPNVVDVASVTKKDVTLNPKAPGSTTLVIWDNFGEQSYKVKVYAEDFNEIKLRVDKLLGKLDLADVYTQAENQEGKVFLLGKVKNAQEREKIFVALGSLKDKVIDLLTVKEEESVIEIDVQVLELDKDATKTLGFSFPGSVDIAETASGMNPALLPGSGTGLSSLFRILNLYRGNAETGVASPFAFKLDALVQEGKARILSRPRLSCQSGKEAELLVGGEKPVFTTSVVTGGGGSTQVEYKEFGIKLKIKPTVTEDGRIKLALNVEVSSVGEAETIGPVAAPTAKAYPLTKRSASTELYLNDGQTMSIGGLVKQKEEEDIRKVPFLGDIPIIGALFRKKTAQSGGGQGERGNTELFILLTPKIVAEKKQAVAQERKFPIISSSQQSVQQPEEQPLTPAEAYAGIIQRRILDNLNYPLTAKSAGFQGTVKLNLFLSYQGELLDVTLKESSGYKILDDNAIYVARSLVPYPPFPSAIDSKELHLEIPIVYKLDQN